MSRSDEWIRTFCERHRQIKSMRESLRAVTQTHELSDAEAVLLLLCADDATANLAQRGLATLTAMSPAAVSGHLESLRQRGLVCGTRDASDRRRQTWSATAKGRQVVDAIGRELPRSPSTVTEVTADRIASQNREAA